MNTNVFYGFRGSIIFPQQPSLFNVNLENNSSTKNQLFRDSFNALEEQINLKSKYDNRIYYLILKNKYDNILHCKLARRKTLQKRELTKNDIIETEIEDYPYVNIFIDLKGQKILVESNTQVFENYDTCSKVIQNIINYNLKEKGVSIKLNYITEEQEFWNYFKDNSKVYRIEFDLVAPNMFNSEDDATNIIKEAEKNVGANKLNITFKNEEGYLNPNKEGIESFIKYIANGGGNWSITTLNNIGKKEIIKSTQKSTKVNVPISNEELKKEILTEEEIRILKDCLNKIEIIEELKES